MKQVIKGDLLFVKHILKDRNVATTHLHGFLVFNETFKNEQDGESVIKKDYGFRGYFTDKNVQFLVSGQMNYFANEKGVSKTIQMTLFNLQTNKTDVIGLKQYPNDKKYVGTCYTEQKDYFYHLTKLEVVKDPAVIENAVHELQQFENKLSPELEYNYNLKNSVQK